MNRERLELVRMTRLDLAQWITSGIGRCTSRETSARLARYAAAQLEGAALVAPTGHALMKPDIRSSLLRVELSRSGGNAADCWTILTRVSRAMVRTLVGESESERRMAMQNLTVARLVRLEVAALRALLGSVSNKAAA